MKKLIPIIVLLLTTQAALQANHIVGGELELEHISGDNYAVRLIQYFDAAQQVNTTRDPDATVYIYRKSDNSFVTSIFLPLVTNIQVEYTNPDCFDASLITDKLTYESIVSFSPGIYNEPEGYYLVWERCCRNAVIQNIINPLGTGMTYLLEFPPVVKDGEPFRNSSPSLFPPLRDYGCVNRLYYTDFAGTDKDGDSLAYSIADPLASSSIAPVPVPTPAPHPLVNWAFGFSRDESIPGNPALGIDSAGFLRVNPSEQGLFVFSVLCEEYRDGEKIGELRRDFQMLVRGDCAPELKPEVFVKENGSDILLDGDATITFEHDEPKCLTFLAVDKDGDERLTFAAVPRNFSAGLNGIFAFSSTTVNSPTDTVSVEVCLPDCPFVLNRPMRIDLIARDQTCALPLQDTVQLTINILPPPNSDPVFTTPVQETVSFSIREGQSVVQPLVVTDADNDSITLEMVTDYFNPEDFGMVLTETRNEPGRVEATFSWDTDCQLYDFTDTTFFEIAFVATEFEECYLPGTDTVFLTIDVELPPNTDPVVSANVPGGGGRSPDDQTINWTLNDPLSFPVWARDNDGDSVALDMIAVNFDPAEYDISFNPVGGFTEVQSTFQWNTDCFEIDLFEQDSFVVQFVAQDFDFCKLRNQDTLTTTIIMGPPPNQPPRLSINGINTDRFQIEVGSALELTIVGEDGPRDSLLLLQLLNDPVFSTADYSFQQVEGIGRVESVLRWTPQCDVIRPDSADNVYNLRFLLFDDPCYDPSADTLDIEITLVSSLQNFDLEPPNVFTPNGDNFNPQFFIPNLPEDNCFNQFEKAEIYNRWGRLIYETENRNFRWSGEDFPAGVYYYYVIYTNNVIKGDITLLR